MGHRDKARFSAGCSIKSVASQNQCPSNFGKLQLTKKDGSIIHTCCSVTFKLLGSLSASQPKLLSPIELDNDDGTLQGIDVDLEYLDDVSIFGCDNDDVWDHSGNEFSSDKEDHGKTGADNDLDDPRR